MAEPTGTPRSRKRAAPKPPRPLAVFAREVFVREHDGTRVPVTLGDCPCPDMTWSDNPRNTHQPHACKHQQRAWAKAAGWAGEGLAVEIVNEPSDETPGVVYPVTLPRCGKHGTPFVLRSGAVQLCEHVSGAYAVAPGWQEVPAPAPTGDQAADAA